MSALALARIVVLGAMVVTAAGWALARHRSANPPPMLIPVSPTVAPTYDADAGEMPVPETIETGEH